MPRRTSTHPVAIVVFLNAEGADPHDCANVGAMAVAAHLEAVGGGRIDVATCAGQRAVTVVRVMELGQAARNDLIVPATPLDAYKP